MYIVFFQTLDIEFVATRIRKELYGEILDVRSSLKFILSKDSKKEAHLSNFNTVFDIARCKCFRKRPKEDFIPSNCLCPKEKKIANFQTYLDQLFDKEAVILVSEEEKLIYQSQSTQGNKCFFDDQGLKKFE